MNHPTRDQATASCDDGGLVQALVGGGEGEGQRRVGERLAMAAKAGGVGIWDYDVVNNRLEWDEQMFRLYGITRDQFSGAYEAWQAGLHPDDRARGDAEIKLALESTKEFDIEFRVLWPDGSIHHIRGFATVERDASGRLP